MYSVNHFDVFWLFYSIEYYTIHDRPHTVDFQKDLKLLNMYAMHFMLISRKQKYFQRGRTSFKYRLCLIQQEHIPEYFYFDEITNIKLGLNTTNKYTQIESKTHRMHGKFHSRISNNMIILYTKEVYILCIDISLIYFFSIFACLVWVVRQCASLCSLIFALAFCFSLLHLFFYFLIQSDSLPVSEMT